MSPSRYSESIAEMYSLISSDTYGRLFPYDKTFDRITTKTEKPLQLVDRIKYNTTTSDDPVMQEVMPFFVAIIRCA